MTTQRISARTIVASYDVFYSLNLHVCYWDEAEDLGMRTIVGLLNNSGLLK